MWEELSETELNSLKGCHQKIAEVTRKEMRAGKSDLGTSGIVRDIRLVKGCQITKPRLTSQLPGVERNKPVKKGLL